MLRLLKSISLRQLSTNWGRAVLVVLGTATGVSLISAIAIINGSVVKNFTRTIDAIAGPADLEVVLGLGEIGFGEEAVEVIRDLDGVDAAIPLVRGTLALNAGDSLAIQLFGVDLVEEEDLGRYHVKAQTDRRKILASFGALDAVFVPDTFAREHSLELGDRFDVVTPNGVQSLVARGLIEATGLASAFGGRLLVMDLPAAQLLLNKREKIDQIDVVVREGESVDSIRERISSALPESLTVRRPEQRGVEYEKIVSSFQIMLTGLSTLCLIAGIFIIFNTTMTGTAQRSEVLGRLRVIGAESGTVLRLLVSESLLLGAIGSVLGVAAGIGLAALLHPMVTDSMGVIYQLRFPLTSLDVSWVSQTAIAGCGVAAVLFASWFAAWRSSRLDPLNVVKGEYTSAVEVVTPSRFLVAWFAMVAISVVCLVAEWRWKSAMFGNLGATLWNASVIVVAVPFVYALRGPLTRLLEYLFGGEGRMAAESMVRTPVRTGITVAAIALVVTVAIFLSSMSLSFRNSMNSYIGRFLAADLTVSATSTEGGWLETPLSRSVVQQIADVRGVESVEALHVLPGQPFRGLRISVAGLTSGFFEPDRYPRGWYREGTAEAAKQLVPVGKSVNVSTALADRTGLKSGDSISLDTPSGILSIPILGVVPDYASDQGTVIMSLDMLERWWGTRSVNRIFVTARSGASLDDVRAAISERLGDTHRLKVLSLREVLDYHDRMIGRAFAFTQAIQLLIVIVTVAGIFDLLVSAIIERRRELSLWRLIGADNRSVRKSVIVESATIGTLGSLLGIPVGLITAWIWISLNFRYLLGYHLERHFAYAHAAWYVFLVIIATIITGYVAADRAIKQPVIENLQKE